MIKPSSDEYNATTDVSQRGRITWVWSARLWQPHPWTPFELDYQDGFAFTEQRAQRKADRAARRMMRAAESWVSRTYSSDSRARRSARADDDDDCAGRD